MYAIVRCGGRQEKAAVDEVLTVDTLAGEAGSSVTLPAVLVVDDGNVISDPAELRRYQITAEILGPVAGPKINMIHFRNKTGYRRRLGHRQRYTQVKITSITAGRSGTTASRKTATDKAGGPDKAGPDKAGGTDKAGSTDKAGGSEKASAGSRTTPPDQKTAASRGPKTEAARPARPAAGKKD